MSGRAHSVLCEMSLIISTFVPVVPTMFDLAHYWGPYLRLYGPPAAGGLRQTSIHYIIMVGYTIYVPVLGCWYLFRLTRMLWAAGL